MMAGCNAPAPKSSLKGTTEYFAESEYGVKASPRVVSSESGMTRGGGRYQVGKPYQIKGRWYRPKEDPNYVAEGKASWYGEAFHGRLTANGEVYDMAHLTAAHPTMPLPSYARVTNLENGNSVIVRVNDRGPFVRDRVIDLSKRAAELLEYRHMGVADVRVEYISPAPLHGNDDQYLLASYRPKGVHPGQPHGLPEGVMLAMNEATPDHTGSEAITALIAQAPIEDEGRLTLPSIGPLVPDRPTSNSIRLEEVELALLSYADRRVVAAASVFEQVLDPRLDQDTIRRWWKARTSEPAEEKLAADYIHLGTWDARDQAEKTLRQLTGLGEFHVQQTSGPGGTLYSASLALNGNADLDDLLRAAWSAGAYDAFAVRGE